jgi:hypothetical protein
LTTIWLPVASHNNGSSILLRGDQLLCHQ